MFYGIKYLFKLVYKLEKGYLLSLLFMEILNGFLNFLYVLLPKYIVDTLFGTTVYRYTAVQYLFFYIVCIVIGNMVIGILKYYSEKKRDALYTKYSIIQGRKFLNCEYAKLEDPEFLKLREQSTKYMNAYGFAGIIPLTTMMIGKLITICSLLSIILFLDYRICLIYLCLTSINLFITMKNKHKIIEENMQMVDTERRKDYLKELFEKQQSAKEVRIYQLKDWLLKKYQTEFDLLNIWKAKKNLHNMKNGISNILLDLFQQIVTYSYLIYCVLKQTITVGNFTMYLTGIISFNNNILSIADTIIDLQQYNEYFEPFRKFNTYIQKEEIGSKKEDLKDTYIIEFKNVSFKYPGQEEYALKNVNVKMTSKEAVCIVGENGAGKSTFIKLLLRFYNVEEGEILLNGINIQDYIYEEYMKCFSALFQDYKLFALSVKENIVLKEKKEEKLCRALELSGAGEMLLKRERNIDTSVFKMFDENGVEFSGGESQKIALARALFKDAPILLLDEPSSALDPISEAELLKKFAQIAKGKLSIFISHRLTSAKICDRILVFKEGKIIEDGTHEILIQKKGLYAQLYEMQSNLYI